MTSPARNAIVFLVIALAITALGLYRAETSGSRAPPAADEVQETVAGRPVLLDFGRGECLACKKMTPVLDTLAERHGKRVAVRYLDLKNPENELRAKELRVRVIPTQILIDASGAEVERHEGFWALEDIEQRLEALEWIPRS